jgi:hypothetical protein
LQPAPRSTKMSFPLSPRPLRERIKVRGIFGVILHSGLQPAPRKMKILVMRWLLRFEYWLFPGAWSLVLGYFSYFRENCSVGADPCVSPAKECHAGVPILLSSIGTKHPAVGEVLFEWRNYILYLFHFFITDSVSRPIILDTPLFPV